MQNVLVKYAPNAILENEYEKEASFNLMTSNHSNFGEMFEEIEQNKQYLGINSCGITVTTMDDVFLQ